MAKRITSFQDFEPIDKALIAVAFVILLVPPTENFGQKGIVVCSFVHLVSFSFMEISDFSLRRRLVIFLWYLLWCITSFFVYSYFEVDQNIFIFAWGTIITWPTLMLFYPQAFYTDNSKKETQ